MGAALTLRSVKTSVVFTMGAALTLRSVKISVVFTSYFLLEFSYKSTPKVPSKEGHY